MHPPRSSRRLLTASLTVAIAAGIAVPTSASAVDPATQAPEAVLQDLARDLAAVKSFRYAGTVRDGRGQLRLSGDSTSSGRFRLTLTQGRQVQRLIRLPSRVYLRFNRAFVLANFDDTKANRRRADRWLRTTVKNAGELGSGIAESEPKRLASCLTRDVGTLSHGGTATVGGKPTIVIVDRGDRPGTTPRKLYLAASGPRLPLRIVQTGKRQPGDQPDLRCRGADDDATRSDLRFTRFDAKLTIAAPKRALKL